MFICSEKWIWVMSLIMFPFVFFCPFLEFWFFQTLDPLCHSSRHFNFSSIFHHLTSQYTFWRIFSSFSSKLSVECFYFWYSVFRFPELSYPQAVAFLLCAVLVSRFQYLLISPWGQWSLSLLLLSSLFAPVFFFFFLMCLCHFFCWRIS